MAKVRVKRGSEGPYHDPYSYTEITFYFTNKKRKPVTIHQGLGDWVKHGKRRYEGNTMLGDPALIFEKLTGLNPRYAERIPDILLGRYLRTLPKEQRWGVIECIEADQVVRRNFY
jgi:hypothetical protein